MTDVASIKFIWMSWEFRDYLCIIFKPGIFYSHICMLWTPTDVHVSLYSRMWRPCFIEMFMPMMDLLVTAGISLIPDFDPTLQCGVPTVQHDRRWRGWPWLPWSRGALGHWQVFGGIHPMFVIERPGVTTQESQWPTLRIWLGFWKPSWRSCI